MEFYADILAFSKGPYLFLYQLSENKIYRDSSWNHNNVITGIKRVFSSIKKMQGIAMEEGRLLTSSLDGFAKSWELSHCKLTAIRQVNFHTEVFGILFSPNKSHIITIDKYK